jgi:hypothetical protein
VTAAVQPGSGVISAPFTVTVVPTYAVVAQDTYGLASNWSAVSGGLLGLGDCSQAQLTNAEVATQVTASTCPGDTAATSPTCSPPTLPLNASVGPPIGIYTLETNNLAAIGIPAVTYPNSDLAVSSLLSSTSGSCLPDVQSPFPVASYVFAPASEISGSLAAQTPVSITVTAYDSWNNPIACAPVWLTFQPAQNGGSLSIPATQPDLLIADSNGQVSFTYTTPAVFPPAGGTDTILAANSANGASTTASWSYTFR